VVGVPYLNTSNNITVVKVFPNPAVRLGPQVFNMAAICIDPTTGISAHVKTPYRGLAKNRAQLFTLFALGNLFLVDEG